jgi:hypothetical protein
MVAMSLSGCRLPSSLSRKIITAVHIFPILVLSYRVSAWSCVCSGGNVGSGG